LQQNVAARGVVTAFYWNAAFDAYKPIRCPSEEEQTKLKAFLTACATPRTGRVDQFMAKRSRDDDDAQKA